MFAALLAQATERGVLLSLYSATGGSLWSKHQYWNTSRDICEWEGVTCNRNGNITELNLQSFGLTGELPAELVILQFLRHLDISNNSLTSWIPEEYCQMHELLVFNAQGAGLIGHIPTCMCRMQFLQTLNMAGNLLNDTIPSCIGNMTFMQTIDLRCNNLVGIVPPSVVDLVYLTSFQVECNSLSCDYVLPQINTSCGSQSCTYCTQIASPCPKSRIIATCGVYTREADCPVRVGDVC